MLLSKIISSSLAVVVTFTCFKGLSEEDKPYYTRNHTWALGTEIKETQDRNIYPRNAFLPSRYLLYIDDRNKTHTISGDVFVRAITQDGVSVYVLDKHVSKYPFAESVGSHEIVFNSAYELCNIKPCDTPKEGNIFPVSRGDAFNIIGSEAGYIEIAGIQEEPVRGYVTSSRLDELRDHGLVTRTDHRHPRYKIKKTKIHTISVTCGKVLEGTLQIDHDKLDDVQFVAESFDLGNIDYDDKQLVIADGQDYGGDGQSIDFFLYSVLDTASQETFNVAAVYKTKCEKEDFQKPKNLFYENVTFKSSRRDLPVKLDIKEFGTREDLREETGAPYLISINEYSHFEAVMKKLSKKIGDRTLAGFALSEINVSCRFSERQKRLGKCRSYSY